VPKFKIRAEDIRKMSEEERLKLLQELRSKLVELRYKARVGLLENPGELRETRRNIARILTIMREERARGKA